MNVRRSMALNPEGHFEPKCVNQEALGINDSYHIPVQ